MWHEIVRRGWNSRGLMLVAAMALLAVQVMPVLAQSLSEEQRNMPAIGVLFLSSPIINGLIALLSVAALLMFVVLMMTITPRSMMPGWFVNEINGLIIQKQYDEAAKLCRVNKGLLMASVIQRCLEHAGQNHSVILDMLDSEGRRRSDIVWNRISYLADIANVSPMLGLLGTVMGMLQAFFIMPETSASITSQAMTQAIGGAMATTFFGLIVAILASVFHSFAKSRATRVLSEVEESLHILADRIIRGNGASKQVDA